MAVPALHCVKNVWRLKALTSLSELVAFSARLEDQLGVKLNSPARYDPAKAAEARRSHRSAQKLPGVVIEQVARIRAYLQTPTLAESEALGKRKVYICNSTASHAGFHKSRPELKGRRIREGGWIQIA